MENLEDLRKEIDEIDKKMKELFLLRMDVSRRVGEYKKKNNLPIFDAKREEKIISQKKENFQDEKLWPYYEKFIKYIMELSKEIQK